MNRCPSPEQLDNFLEERLGDSERSVIARHIDRCASCQAKLEELTSDVGSNSSVILQRTVLEPAVSGTSPVDFLSRVKENPPSEVDDPKPHTTIVLRQAMAPTSFRPWRAMKFSASWGGEEWELFTRPGTSDSIGWWR